MTNTVGILIQGVVLGAGSELSFNLLQALNSLRCMVLSGGTNMWQLFASIWYFAMEFKFEAEIKKYADEYWPYVCTCRKEGDVFVKVFKATASAITVMSGCTPEAQQQAANDASAQGS